MKELIYRCTTSAFSKFMTSRYLAVFCSFCVFCTYCIYSLLNLGLGTKLTITNCILFMFGLYSFYFLLIIPITIIVEHSCTNFDLNEELIFVRHVNRKDYALYRIASLVIFAFIHTFLLYIAVFALFSLVAPYSGSWAECNEEMKNCGFVLIQKELYGLSGAIVILVQLSFITLSFIANGLLLLLLKLLIKRQALPVILVLILDILMLLCHHSNFPSSIIWIFPYYHVLLGYAVSYTDLFINFIYWIAVNLSLCLAVMKSIQVKDFIAYVTEQ